jgi:hypothetical protein
VIKSSPIALAFGPQTDRGLGFLYRFAERRYSVVVDPELEIYSSSLEIELEEYPILKRTPKGVWIDTGYSIGKKFVNLTARKQFACETIEEAKKSFLARKKKQISILTHQIREAEQAIVLMKNV